MMYRHNNMAVNLNDIRTMEATPTKGIKDTGRGCWSISITYCDNHIIFINGLDKEEAYQLLDSMVREINGGN